MPQGQPVSANPSFNFSEHSPTKWASLLSERKAQGVRELTTWVRWASHEKSIGLRDFSSSSRLRLERFLQLCQTEGIRVRLHVGFDDHPESLPDWLLSQTIDRSLVFGRALASGGDPLALAEIPSLWAAPVQESFFAFFSELLDIVALYVEPEGPVIGINFEFGPYQNDLAWLDSAIYPMRLEQRFASIQALNLRYAAAFKDFPAAASRRGFRTTVEKRPWLAADDFQRVQAAEREAFTAALSERLGTFDRARFTIGAASAVVPPAADDTAAGTFVFDATPLQIGADRAVLPLCPSAAVHPAYFQIYNLTVRADAIAQGAGWRSRAFGGADVFATGSPQRPPTTQPSIVLASRYIRRDDARALLAWVREGGRVFFLGGLPRFDENVSPVEWEARQWKEAKFPEGWAVRRADVGAGSVCVPAQEIASVPALLEKLPTLLGNPLWHQ